MVRLVICEICYGPIENGICTVCGDSEGMEDRYDSTLSTDPFLIKLIIEYNNFPNNKRYIIPNSVDGYTVMSLDKDRNISLYEDIPDEHMNYILDRFGKTNIANMGHRINLGELIESLL